MADMDCLYVEGCGVSSAECCVHLVDVNRVICNMHAQYATMHAQYMIVQSQHSNMHAQNANMTHPYTT